MRTILSAFSALLLSTTLAAAAAPQAPQSTSQQNAAPAAGPASSNSGSANQKATNAKTHSMSRRQVEEIQTALNKGGAKLAVDGVYGPKTRAAVEDFQKQNHLKVTGRADQETLQKLQPQHMS